MKSLPQVKNFEITGQQLTLKGESGKLQLVYTVVADTTKSENSQR